jgi:hypothetical protein
MTLRFILEQSAAAISMAVGVLVVANLSAWWPW